MYIFGGYRGTWQPAVFKCSEKQSGHNQIPGYILAPTSPTRTYAYVYTTNSSTRRRVISWRHARPHQVRWRPRCRQTHLHFRDRLWCLRPLFLSFPLLLPLEVVASLTATLPPGLLLLLPWRIRCGSLGSPVKYLASRLLHVAYACVYLRIHAYACVYLRIPAFTCI